MENASLKRIQNFSNALAEFKRAAHNLCNAWNALDNCETVEDRLIDDLCESVKYPFPVNFDCVVGNMEYWSSCFEHSIAIAEREAMKRR